MKQLTYWGRRVHFFADKGLAYHCSYGRWRLGNWLQRISDRSFCPSTATLLAEVDLEGLALAGVRKAVATGNTDSALTSLTTHFRARTNPLFFFGCEDKQNLISLIRNDQKETTVRVADEICQNVFHFRQVSPVEFKDGIDWTHCSRGNIDWTWDLNRHAYFETLGRAYWYTDDEQYAQKFRELLLDWLANNPASVNQPNWASVFEVAFRISTWIWAFHYFRSSAVFDHKTCLAFLKGLLAHGRYLDTNLELHVRNNHLLLEAKALAMVGLLFPEFKRAERWWQRGLNILYQQISAQVCPDGVHGERATHYHRVIAGELLELLVLLENNNVPIPVEIVEALGRMVKFELWITKPNGLIPLFGDSALEDTHLRFSAASAGPAFLGQSDLRSIAPPLDEASVWLLGAGRIKRYSDTSVTDLSLNSRAFPEGGYFIMRSGRGPEAAYLAFDCGPFGYEPTPNHGHADALSFELHAFGQTLLVDPGVYSTHLGQDWRNFFRGSRAHNTIVVDDQDQSILLDTRRVYRPAQVTVHQWTPSDHFDFVDGSHDGYERLSEPITHRRQVFFVKPEYWVVIDWLMGQGKHCFDLYFHLMPGIDTRLDLQSKSLRTGNGTVPGLAIVPLATTDLQTDIVSGNTAPIQGWVSLFSGEKQPAPTLRYRQEAVAPVRFGTVLYPCPAGENVSLAVSPLDVMIEDQQQAVEDRLTGLRVETDTYTDYLVIEREPTGTRKSFAGYETDAQLICIRHGYRDEGPIKVIMRGGSRLLFQDQSLLRTDGRASDFTLDHDTRG